MKKTYIINNQTWYYNLSKVDNNKSITIELVADEGMGCIAEFSFIWDYNIDAILFHAFNDAWGSLNEFPELSEYMEEIAQEKHIPSIEEFAEHLDAMGYCDVTERKK